MMVERNFALEYREAQQRAGQLRENVIEMSAAKLGAVPADVPGLWWIPGRMDVPELTTGQLIDLACRP